MRITTQNNLSKASSAAVCAEPLQHPTRSYAGLRALAAAFVVVSAFTAGSLRSRPQAQPAALRAVTRSAATARPMGAPSKTESAATVELTSCQELIHIGDSTSLGLKSKSILPDEDDRIAAKYERIGVTAYHPEISGARSMVETYKENPSATKLAKEYRAKDYHGCWVLALGTNDPANTKGDAKLLSARIDAIMKIIGDDPVLWTTTKSLRKKGAYHNSRMESWNKTITEACSRYPNMRVYDWASEVKDDWFTGDGLHPNSAGYKERSLRIAKAVARAFPKSGASPAQCLIRAD